MENLNNQLEKIQSNELSVYTNDNGRFIHDPKPIRDIVTLKECYNLTIEKINESDLLSKENKDVILATLNHDAIIKLNIVQYDNSYNELVGMFAKMIVESGIGTMNEEEQTILISLFIEEVKNEFSYLTLEDVRLALKKGVI